MLKKLYAYLDVGVKLFIKQSAKMKTLKYLSIITLILISGTACKKTTPSAPDVDDIPEFVQLDQYTKKYKNGVVEVTYLPVDTTRKAGEIRDYYNFESSKMISADQVLTDKWDIAFQGRYSYSVYHNLSKTNVNQPWRNPDGIIKVSYAFVLKNFDEVNEVSTDLEFESTDQGPAMGTGADITYEKYGNAWAYDVADPEVNEFLYTIPFKNKTTIFKLNDGRYVKFQYINNYNNKPEENSVKSKRGSLSFRYFIAKKGSTDLKTK